MFISVTFVIDSMENPNRYADIYNEYDSNQKKKVGFRLQTN